MPQSLMLKELKLMILQRPRDLLELTAKKDVLFNIGDWNAKVGSQEISEVTSKFALEYKMKQGKS